jgi:hypothetical protein
MVCTPARHYQHPKYGIDLARSRYSSYERKHNEHIFTVEQGTQFYLKLNLTANPMPVDDSEDLYQNDDLLQYSPQGTVESGLDFMRIRTVNHSHAGKYKIVSKNIAGKGQITFHLKVKCKYTHGTINGE